MKIVLTDASAEMGDLIALLSKLEPSGNSTWEVLAGKLGLNPASHQFMEILGTLGARLSRFEEFVHNVEDDAIDRVVRDHVLQSIANLAGLLNPTKLIQQWASSKAQHINQSDIAVFRMFSAQMRPHRPLRKLSEEDRIQAIKEIDELRKEVKSDEDLPLWTRAPLLEGLQHLQLVLKYLSFFGHDAAVEELFVLHHKVSTMSRQAGVDDATGQPGKPRSFMRTLEVLGLCAALFAAPDTTATALERYKGWMVNALTADRSTPPKLLPPPSPPQTVEDV